MLRRVKPRTERIEMNYLIRLNGSDDKIEIITEDELDMYKKNYDVEILEQTEKYFTKKFQSVCISMDVDCDVTLAYMKLK